jgi:opacity protein-like surface antigen
MKKILTLALFAVLLAGPLMAQKEMYFGISGTGLSSVITNQNNYGLPFEMDYKAAFGGGVNANVGFDFNKNIGLKLEIGYAKLGQKYEDTYKDTLYTRNIRLNYLQIPLLFKFRTSGEVARFYVMAGPQFNILLSASQEYLKSGADFDSLYKPGTWPKPVLISQKTITERFASFDIMGRLDLGVDISLGKSLFINVGLTMAYGFLDINATDYQIPNYSSGDYNPSHNIYGGLNFGINYVLPIGGSK